MEKGTDDRKGKTQPQIRVTAAQKRKRALELRLAGLNYRQIAEQVPYGSVSQAHRAVKAELANIPKDAADELRTVELERYDEIQARLIASLRSGNLAVVRDLIRLSDQRAKLMGLYTADTTGEHVDVKISLSALLADARDIADEEDSAQVDSPVDSAA